MATTCPTGYYHKGFMAYDVNEVPKRSRFDYFVCHIGLGVIH